MQVNLEQADVEKAIALFLRSMGITATVDEVSFKAGRSGSGLTTSVKLVDTQHAPIPQQKNTTGIRSGSTPGNLKDDPLPPEPQEQKQGDGTSDEEPAETEEGSNDTSESLFK